jgi:2-amino-4-hydroxy-6-hydroxymethyldihydropteridine diphosphokinase
MAEVILGLGGNTGDRLKNLTVAGGLLTKELGIIIAFSPVVESEPWGFKSASWFLNQILVFQTSLSASRVMAICLDVEEAMGRKRSGIYSDRAMDIDILFYDKQVILEEDIIVPHPRLHERLFVLKPLQKIKPDLMHPVLGLSVKEMYEACQDQTKTNWFRPD